MDVVPENNLDGQKVSLDEGNTLFYLKLVGVSKKSLEDGEFDPVEVVKKVSGNFLVGKDMAEMRELLHKVVDQACDAWEQQKT